MSDYNLIKLPSSQFSLTTLLENLWQKCLILQLGQSKIYGKTAECPTSNSAAGSTMM